VIFFWDPNTGLSSYEFPKNSGKHSNFRNSIWIAGKDTNNVLHVSAQAYRQNGNDFWSGPLDTNGSLDSITSESWDKIWKVNRSTIDSFKQMAIHNLNNTHLSILQWPSKGNTNAVGKNGAQLNITTDMAPFLDNNGDGIYNAFDGDYPLIKGEQALWWVFSDNGHKHNQTNALPFKFEFHAMAYACNNEPLKDVIYLNLEFNNKSNMPYHDIRTAIDADLNLGGYDDDYIGCDTSLGLGICYNGDANDTLYGSNLTQLGALIKISPNNGNPNKLGCFSYYKFGGTSSLSEPSAPADYSNLLNAKWKDGSSLTRNCLGYNGSIPTNYIFADEISLAPIGNSEIACSNTKGSRKFLLASSNFYLLSNQSTIIEYAFMNTPLGSDNNSFAAIKSLASTVINTDVGECKAWPLGVNQFNFGNQFSIFPQPSRNQISIQSNEILFNKINLFSIDGQLITQQHFNQTKQYNFVLPSLVAGNYILMIETDKGLMRKKIVVE
jgi:Secretion system C-terminal sorting domain